MSCLILVSLLAATGQIFGSANIRERSKRCMKISDDAGAGPQESRSSLGA